MKLIILKLTLQSIICHSDIYIWQHSQDRVFVKRGPNLRTCAVVVSTTDTHVVIVGPTLHEGCETLLLEKVVRHDAIECTQHQISAATHHAHERFPGAAVLKEEILRAGNLTPERAEAVANFLRDPTVGCRVCVGLLRFPSPSPL